MRKLFYLSLISARLLSAEEATHTTAPTPTPQTTPVTPDSTSKSNEKSGSANFSSANGGELQVYTHPGIVVNQGGRWVGSDHLLNLSRNVRIISEILKPADTLLPFNEGAIDKKLQDSFVKHGFDTAGASGSAAPFFNLLIVVYPIEQGYVALVDGRLMEAIDPKRVKLDPDTQFQAITWEKKTLLVAPKDEFESTIEKSIDDITNTFFERYDYFDRLKSRMEQRNDTERMR